MLYRQVLGKRISGVEVDFLFYLLLVLCDEFSEIALNSFVTEFVFEVGMVSVNVGNHWFQVQYLAPQYKRALKHSESIDWLGK